MIGANEGTEEVWKNTMHEIMLRQLFPPLTMGIGAVASLTLWCVQVSLAQAQL